MNNLVTFSKVATILFYGLLATASSCTKNTDSQATNTLLLNCWTNSYEEHTEGETVLYRPCDFMEFPASRYRMRFELEENQVCHYSVLAPNDAHYTETGTWEYQSEPATIIIKSEAGEVVYQFNVIELEADKLVITEQ